MKTVNTVHFQAGRLVVVDSTGAMPVAELSDCNITHDAEDKALPTTSQIANFSIRTGQKVTVKAKVERVLSQRLHAAMFGGTLGTNASQVVDKESHPAAGTVVATNTTTFVVDLGVFDNNGNAMTPIASAPQVGEYVAGAAGVGSYTFNAGQTGNVFLCYVKSTTSGEKVSITNSDQAASPTLEGYFWSVAKQPDGTTSNLMFHFQQLVPTKLSEAQKRGDFGEADIELDAIAKADGSFYERHHVQA
jgi:hypothetical protein